MSNYILRQAIRGLLVIHNKSYEYVSSLSRRYHGGTHPKYKLMKYYDFFVQKIPKNSTVLDIGCGMGNVSIRLAKAKKNLKITAVDINNKSIQFAKNKNKHQSITYMVKDATTMKLDKKFDYIVLSNVLEHIDKRVVFLKSIKDLADTLLIRVPMVTRDWITLYKKQMKVDYRLDPTHFTEYSEEQFYNETSKAGLKVISYKVQFGEIYAVVKKNR